MCGATARLFHVNLTISAALGCFFSLWIRVTISHGWYALTALFWVLFAANIVATSPWPFATTLAAAPTPWR